MHHPRRGSNTLTFVFSPQQKADKRAEVRSDANPKSTIHAVVVTHHQSSKCICWLSSATRLDWHFHARKDPNAEDLVDSNLQSPSLAEDPRVPSYGGEQYDDCREKELRNHLESHESLLLFFAI
jgi:hypothetical protein